LYWEEEGDVKGKKGSVRHASPVTREGDDGLGVALDLLLEREQAADLVLEGLAPDRAA
jgi:hypothetical protein